MNFASYVIPVLFILLVVFACFRGLNVYEGFVDGAKEALPFALSIFPYLAVIFIMTEAFSKSGLAEKLNGFLSPLWSFLGIPTEIGPLVLIKPFSGSGSLAVLADVYAKYGADGYISRCATCVFGSSETVFYVSAVYFAKVKGKNLALPVVISLIATFASVIVACLLCRIM